MYGKTSNINVKILIKELCFGSLHITWGSNLILLYTSLCKMEDIDVYLLMRKSKLLDGRC